MKIVSPAEAVKNIKSNDHVYIHAAAAAPKLLVEALTARHDELSGVKIYQLHTEGPAPYAAKGMETSFSVYAFFIGKNVRSAIQEGRAFYVPVFLSEVPRLFRKNIIRLHVALISVSPPDAHGFCSLGTSVEATRAAIEKADIVIAQINRFVPRTIGDANIHVSDIDFATEGDFPLYTHDNEPLTDVEKNIGKFVASLVEDGATLQMGIGNIPNAALNELFQHKDLAIHTEMFSDGIIPLVEQGIITGRAKKKHNGKIVGTFLLGSQKLYDFVDNNPGVLMLDVQYVNDTAVIRQLPKMTSINSAIEIDITGQVCADSIGTKMYSGVGGQMDFIRGASLSEGGKAIIALPATTSKGISRIVSELKPGAGVVTTRAHVQYVVTEYGIAELYGKSLQERAAALISIAHPDHRDNLSKEFFTRFK